MMQDLANQRDQASMPNQSCESISSYSIIVFTTATIYGELSRGNVQGPRTTGAEHGHDTTSLLCTLGETNLSYGEQTTYAGAE